MSHTSTASRPVSSRQSDHDAPAEGNQYASKSELLEWINGLLQLQLSRCVCVCSIVLQQTMHRSWASQLQSLSVLCAH